MAIQPNWHALTYTTQYGFDQIPRSCDLNFVIGEDFWVRAHWVSRPFIWHIYPQDDNAHHAKLAAFLDWVLAPESLRRAHHAWNGFLTADLAAPTSDELIHWG